MFGTNNGAMQCFFFFRLNFLKISYSVSVKPFKSALSNVCLVISEAMTLAISIAYFQFRVESRSSKTMAFGFIVIGNLSFLILFTNFTILGRVCKICRPKRKPPVACT